MLVMSVLEEVSEELSELLSWVGTTLCREFLELSSAGWGGHDILGLLLDLLEDMLETGGNSWN